MNVEDAHAKDADGLLMRMTTPKPKSQESLAFPPMFASLRVAAVQPTLHLLWNTSASRFASRFLHVAELLCNAAASCQNPGTTGSKRIQNCFLLSV